MKPNKSRTLMLFGLALVLIVLIIVISYAAFKFSQTGNVINTITIGDLKMTLDGGDAISLAGVLPITDEEGLSLDGYSFTLKNDGDTSVNYYVYIDNIDIAAPDVKLDDKYLKYTFTKNGTESAIDYLTNLGTDGNRLLDSGTLASGSDAISYNLKLWPTVDVDGEFAGHVWKGRIRVVSEQMK